MTRQLKLIALATAVAASVAVPATTGPTASAAPASRMRHASPAAANPAMPTATWATTGTAGPPSTRYCRNHPPYLPCYGPWQLRRAYRINALWKAGLKGRGAVIGIVDSFGSPTIRHDLHVFDQAYNLPDPPTFRIVRPAGPIPTYDGSSSLMRGWAGETTLDVEWAHAIAPRATIVLAETPVAETEGVHGFPDMMRSERWLIRNTRVGVISQSFGATEETFPSASSIKKLRYAFVAARRHNVTVLAASGDTGSTDYRNDMSTLYGKRVNSWPSTDPLVTSVGGTQLHLADDGSRTAADSVWNDSSFGGGASGGGVSHVFGRPAFQNAVQSTVGTHRGTPDISMNAAESSRVVMYASFGGAPAGWKYAAGTSEACPLFAGVLALAIQKRGHRLGDINPVLYKLGVAGAAGLVDVVGGSNAYAGVRGWPVKTGFDMGTGWGTLDASKLVQELVQALNAQ